MQYTKSDIDSYLQDCFFATISFSKDDHLVSDLMIFSHDIDGEFYFWSRKIQDFFEGINDNPNVCVNIYKEEETLQEMKYCSIWGKAEIITDFESEKAKKAFELIGEKSPLAREIPYEEDKHKNCIICLSPVHIEFIGFDELKKAEAPTILEL